MDYAADVQQTRAALKTATAAFAEQTIPGEDRGSAVVLSNLGDNAVEWKVRLWVATADYWSIHESLMGEIKQQLDTANISIPFPQLDVHLNRVDSPHEESPLRPRVRPVRRENDLAIGPAS